MAHLRAAGRVFRFSRVKRIAACVMLAAAVGCCSAEEGSRDLAPRHARLLKEIERNFRQTATYTGIKKMDPEVRAALAATPREAFVLPAYRDDAYDNRPLHIGSGQTISQPFIVALMTQLLDLEPTDRVLEIGTGSGYQAAVLSHLAAEVFSIEIVASLADRARRTLEREGYPVQVRHGDGNAGWPEQAPFDAIIVTAAGPLPPRLVDQLKPGGRLVMPYQREEGRAEMLSLVRKNAAGELAIDELLPVRFVPLTGDTGAPD